MRASLLPQFLLAPYTSPANFLQPPVTPGCEAGSIQISRTWQVLGPFQIGTREAEWGADPLKYHGGFQNIPFNATATFKSSLATNGIVNWSVAQFSPYIDKSGSGTITIGFNSTIVDWDFLRSIYGWSGTQFQAWARGSLLVCPGPSQRKSKAVGSDIRVPVNLHISPVLEYFLDKKPYYGGDMYGYRRAPAVPHLTPGVNYTLDIRITHDIRAFGGGMPPALEVFVEISMGEDGMGLVAEPKKAVVPDIVMGMIAGEGWASLPVRNERFKDWIEILKVASVRSGTDIHQQDAKAPVQLAPGQSRPLVFRITKVPFNATSIELLIQYRLRDSDEISNLLTLLALTTVQSLFDTHIFTYRHPSGIVSYAALRPPSQNATCPASPDKKIPILLSLHGAGVDVHWDLAKEAYKEMPNLCAWLLFPQGVTLWSGDDWHLWGWADVEAAIFAIPHWIRSIGWSRQSVDTHKLVVTGHSNGGQGTWYALTHNSDKIIAAIPLSGYLSIPAYVPYHMWHEADAKKIGLVLAAMNPYRHELLVENCVGTPVMQGHGQLDDNVPAFHSRRMRLLSSEAGLDTDYIEFPGRAHWWDGVMTDGDIPSFLNYYIDAKPEIPVLPSAFRIVIANPADMGARGGIIVEQLHVYDQIGKIDVERKGELWEIKTQNIRKWRFGPPRPGLGQPKSVIIDNQPFASLDDTKYAFKMSNGRWTKVDCAPLLYERTADQMGALDAIFQTKSGFQIVLPTIGQRKSYHEALAVEISRNLFQYYGADSVIISEESGLCSQGNYILLNLTNSTMCEPGITVEFPVTIFGDTLSIKNKYGRNKTYSAQPGLGAIFLKPVGEHSLAIVIWGVDEEGLRGAARLLPLRTGVGQPNLIVIGREAGWKGVGGVMAMAMFDSEWKIQDGFF
ncbi:hypothetical protein BDZ91DRAFT_695632 [Kalaharituber pfeilii]|nr:hypothetical protein BDZ91DRAFT_695632 [Kalaharituber pfeilii]